MLPTARCIPLPLHPTLPHQLTPRAHTYTYTHTCTHKHTHTHIHRTCSQQRAAALSLCTPPCRINSHHVHTHTHINTHAHTNTLTHSYTQTQDMLPTARCSPLPLHPTLPHQLTPRAHTYTYTHTCTHKHTHTHTYTGHAANSALHPSPSAPHLAGLSDEDCMAANVTEDVLCRCAFEDIFIDSKFLKQGGRHVYYY